MSWLKAFKIALIQEDEKQLSSLIDELPKFESTEAMQEASYLIEQAIVFFKNREKMASVEMQKIRKAKKYLEH